MHVKDTQGSLAPNKLIPLISAFDWSRLIYNGSASLSAILNSGDSALLISRVCGPSLSPLLSPCLTVAARHGLRSISGAWRILGVLARLCQRFAGLIPLVLIQLHKIIRAPSSFFKQPSLAALASQTSSSTTQNSHLVSILPLQTANMSSYHKTQIPVICRTKINVKVKRPQRKPLTG